MEGLIFFGALVAGVGGIFLLLKLFEGKEPEKKAELSPAKKLYDAILREERKKDGDARFAIKDEIEKELSVADGIIVAVNDFNKNEFNPFLYYNGDQHLLLMSIARGGKFVDFIAPNLLHCGDRSMIVIDPKGQAAAVTARRRRELGHKTIFINPFSMHCGEPWGLQGSGFNPLAALDPASDDFVDRTMSITEALIQDGGKDNHWSDSARDILAAIIMQEVVNRGATTLGNVRAILTMPEDERLDYVKAMTTCAHEAVKELAGRFLAQNNEINGIFSEAITQTRFLTSPLIKTCLDGDDFRFEKLKEEKITVYIIIPARYLKSQSRFLRLMVVSAVDAMMSSEKKQGDNSVLFMLDEFASLGYLSSVENAMGLAAGYGLQLWPIIQDFNQLRGIYGDRWETFLGNAGVTIVRGANDNFTGEYISKMVGETVRASESANLGDSDNYYLGENASKSKGFSSGMTASEIKRPLMPIHELRGEFFKDGHLIFKSNLAYPIPARAEHYHQMPFFKGKFDLDPYHLPGANNGGAAVNENQQEKPPEPPEPAKPKQVSLNDRMRQAAQKGV